MFSYLLVILSLLSVGCITPEDVVEEGSPIRAVDDLGRNITLESYPERIVSTAPSNTEILFALGLGERVVGVTEYCDYPEEAREKEKVGGFSTVDVERIIALKPDLVLASELTGNENIQKLEELGIPVVVLQPKNLDGILEDIKLVGKLTGVEDRAYKLEAEMRERIEAVYKKTRNLEKPKVFYVVWHDPLMSAGSETFISDLISMAGGVNIAQDLVGYKTISLEAVVDRDPDIIIASVGPGQHSTYDFLMEEKRLQETSALRNNRVYGIDQDIVSRAGPRIVDGLEEFAKFIHPKVFGG